MNEVNLELLIGKRVFDANGQKIGRVEEIHAVEEGDDLVVSEYLVGTAGLFERFSIYSFGLGLLRFFGARISGKDPRRIPWQELDISDPERPKLRK